MDNQQPIIIIQITRYLVGGDRINNIEPYKEPDRTKPYCPLITEERWLYITENSVPNIKPNAYLISSYGRVYSKLSNTFMAGFISCWGYYRITVQSKIDYKIQVKFSVHRVMMMEFCPIPNCQNMDVNHIDGNKLNNTLSNLEWVTKSENSLFCYKEGLRVAPNNNKNLGNKRSSYKNEEEDVPNELKCQVIDAICKGLDDLTIHRRFDVSMNYITKVRYELQGISVNCGINNNRYNEVRLIFTDDQIHAICKYFQDHKNVQYRTKAELYRNCLYELFGIEYDSSLFNAMSRYYKRKYRKDITDLYDY